MVSQVHACVLKRVTIFYGHLKMNCLYHDIVVSTLNVTMCLIPNDYLSNVIRRSGSWRDCDEIVHASKHSDLFLDVGANIGACTIQALVKTSAEVYAVEPIPKHLFYLNQSLHLLNAKFPFLNVFKRVKVFPHPVGSRTTKISFKSDTGNTGHTTVEEEKKQEQNFLVNTLDTMLLTLVDRKRVTMKIDVEGFECHVFLGMHSIFKYIDHLQFEMSDTWLSQQGCSKEILLGILSNNGFHIPRHLYKIHSKFGTNMLVHKI